MAELKVGSSLSFVGESHVGDPPDYDGFPVQVASTYGEDTTGSPYTIPMPAGIASGDLLEVDFYCQGGSTVTLPVSEAWTQTFLFQGTVGSSDITLMSYARIADGSETAHTLLVLFGGPAIFGTHLTKGAHASALPEAGTTSTGASSTTPNPPSLSPSWGSAKTLFRCFSATSQQTEATVFPLPNANHNQVGSSHGAMWACAIREEASSKDPGTFTVVGASNWAANTIAIRPASGDITLTQPSRLANANTLFTGAVQAARTVTQASRLANANTLFAARIDLRIAQVARLANTNTLFAGTVSLTGTTLTQAARLANANTLFAARVDLGITQAARLANAGHAVTVLEQEQVFTDEVRGEGMVGWGFEQIVNLGLEAIVQRFPVSTQQRG